MGVPFQFPLDRGRSDPATPTEESLTALWTEALGSAPQDSGIEFFAAGGTSLALVQLLAGVEDTWGVELPLELLFTNGFTIRSAAATIDELLLEGLDADELSALQAELDGMSEAEINALLGASGETGETGDARESAKSGAAAGRRA
jgi:acyl carrier protein